MSNNAPLGIFDSGHGGLTVVREVQKQLPGENIIYFGDLARIPYGSKSREEIIRFNFEIIRFLISKQVKMILIACNTSAALAMDEVMSEFDIIMLGLIQPISQTVVRVSKNKKIAVLATEATVKSGAYKKYISMADSKTDILEIACPEFVPIVEANKVADKYTAKIVENYMKKVNQFGADCLIHGCSHYPFLQFQMQKFAAENLKFLDPAISLVEQTEKMLGLDNNLNLSETSGKIQYFVSYYDKNGIYRVKEDALAFEKKLISTTG